MIDRIMKWLFYIVVTLGIAGFIMLVIPSMAKAQHDTNPRMISFSYSCTDADVVTALVQAGDRRMALMTAFADDGTCEFKIRYVLYHQVIERVIWLGDGLDDVMVIIEGEAPDGTARFSWAMEVDWDRMGIGGHGI